MDSTEKQTPSVQTKTGGNDKNEKLFAALAYLGVLFFLPLVMCPESQFGRFHANQGLVLLLFGAIGNLVLAWIPLIHGVLLAIYNVLMLLLFVVGVLNVLDGRTRDLPVIGSIRILK